MSTYTCTICFHTIPFGDRVEILLKNVSCQSILGKYKWYQTTFCYGCLQAARKLLWRHFISLLLESDSVCVANMLTSLKYYDIPMRITDNMRVDGQPIYALYYRGEMITSKLETGMSEMGIETFKSKIKTAKNAIELEFAKGKKIKETIDTVLKDLFQNMNVF
jgi:hypothetical protein